VLPFPTRSLVRAAVVFRKHAGALVDGPPLTGDTRVQVTWLVVTTVLVMSLAALGTIDLLGESHGVGGGQGPNPLTKPSDMANVLQVQVIGQQWLWTYRYPSYGGVETYDAQVHPELSTAPNVLVASYDVNFWATHGLVNPDASVYRPRFIDITVTPG